MGQKSKCQEQTAVPGTDKMIAGMSPLVFLGSIYIIIMGKVFEPSDFAEFGEAVAPLLNGGWVGWVSLVVSGFCMFTFGFPGWKTIVMASVIGLVGGFLAAAIAGSGISFFFYMGILLFLVIPACDAVLNRFT